MKKIFTAFMFAIMMTVSSFAQQTTVEGSKFFDNTYVGVTVGGQTGMNDLTGHNNWTVAPTGSVYLGKNITPIFGIELNGDVLFHDGFTSRNCFVDATYVGLNGRVNLNNVFHVYRGVPDRVECVPFVGFGWIHSYGNGGSDFSHNLPTYISNGRNGFATKMGVDVMFNLGKSRAWVIDVKPTVEYALTGQNIHFYNKNYGRVGLEVGFTYKFGHKNSMGVTTHNFTKAYTVREYNEREFKTDTIYLTNEVIKERIVEVEKVTTMPTYMLTSPYFEFNKSNLDPTTNHVLNILADQINSNNHTYTITGYASLEGDETYNQNLSLQRAEVVRDALVERGVNTNRLIVVAGGATDKFGTHYESNRTVVVTENK